jgi:transcriptional regulator with XRE-family HTH domain
MSTDLDEELAQEATRITRLLDQMIRVSGTSKNALEKRMGWSAGYLSRLANGSIELRLRHILLLAKAVGISPAEFFHAAYPRPAGPESELASFLAALSPAAREPGAPAPLSPPPSEQEMENRLAAILIRPLGRLVQPPDVTPQGQRAAAPAGKARQESEG